MDSEIEIRQMAAGDWKAVEGIYSAGLVTGDATFETEAPSWEKWDKGHIARPRLVAVSSSTDGAVGWAALSPISTRAAYRGVAEVSVYVAETFRGKGVGKALLKQLVADSEQMGFYTLQASVFPENIASLVLHESCGFRVVGTRQRIGQVNGIWRDTVLLERRSEIVGNESSNSMSPERLSSRTG